VIHNDNGLGLWCLTPPLTIFQQNKTIEEISSQWQMKSKGERVATEDTGLVHYKVNTAN
jgi:hypothetical protein